LLDRVSFVEHAALEGERSALMRNEHTCDVFER
jgi:hypothetical protein